MSEVDWVYDHEPKFAGPYEVRMVNDICAIRVWRPRVGWIAERAVREWREIREVTSLRTALTEATARVAVLEEAVLKYGEHRGGCPTVHSAKGACSCGLSAVLGAPSPTTGAAWRGLVALAERVVEKMSQLDVADDAYSAELHARAQAAPAAARAVMGG